MVPLANAQKGEHSWKEHRAERLERMTQELGLSAEQAARMKSIQEEHAAKHEALRGIEDPDQRRTAMKEQAKAQHEAMQAVLTPDQREKAEALRAEHRERMKETRKADPKARVDMRTQRLTTELELAPEQTARVRAIMEQHMEKKQRAAELTDEAARKQAMNELRNSERRAIQAVLTPQQQERWKAMQEARKTKAGQHSSKRHGN